MQRLASTTPADGLGRTGIQAAGTGATVSSVWRIRRKVQVSDNFSQEDPGAVFAADHVAVFGIPADACRAQNLSCMVGISEEASGDSGQLAIAFT